MDIHYLYKRDSEESHDDFFKSDSHNICIANFRPMIDINYIHSLDNYLQVRCKNREHKQKIEEEKNYK